MFPFRTVVPLPASLNDASSVMLPTGPLYFTVPVPASTVNAKAPSTVEPNVTLPPMVVSAISLPKATGPVKVKVPVVVCVPFSVIMPELLLLNVTDDSQLLAPTVISPVSLVLPNTIDAQSACK